MSNSFHHNFPTLDKSIVQRLQAIRKDGELSLFTKVVNLYHIEVKRLLNEIDTSFAKHDSKLLYESIHSLKSCSGNIGATQLAALCQTFLEKIKHDKTQFDLFNIFYTDIKQELDEVMKLIAQSLKDECHAS